MRELDLFTPEPIRSKPALAGELPIDGRTYCWQFHPERVADDWTEQLSPYRNEFEPPGWAFGLLGRDHGGNWRPVHLAGRVWTAWQEVRKDPRVRELLGERLWKGGGT